MKQTTTSTIPARNMHQKVSHHDRTSVDATKAITPEQREAMIAEAAYYISEKNGFNPEMSLECWTKAEKQINKQLLDL